MAKLGRGMRGEVDMSCLKASCSTLAVIPGRDEAASPESITTIGSMDSGLALRAPRNDDAERDVATHKGPHLRWRGNSRPSAAAASGLRQERRQRVGPRPYRD